MPHRLRITGAALALALLGPAFAQQAEKKIYCWEEGGRKVCGDALPASASDNARTEFSIKSGLARQRVDRALSEDERRAAELAHEQARLQAEAEAMQKRRDLAMVESYSTEADLRRAYGERTGLLDETIKASELGLGNLRLSLLHLLRQASDKELAGEIVPPKLTASIRQQHEELLRQQQILAAQKLDRSALDADLVDALERYRALKKPDEPEAAGATAASPEG